MAVETCYRHPETETRVHCTRCERPICPECMTPAPVGHHCPTCIAEGSADLKRRRLTLDRGRFVTATLIGMNLAMFALQLALGGAVGGGISQSRVLLQLGAMHPLLVAEGEYWRLFTSMFLHVGVLHIAFNLFVLHIFGSALESVLGRLRFAAVYLVTGFCASAASFVFGGPNRIAVGASGAIFGLLGAWLAYNWRRRRLASAEANVRMAVILIAANLVLGLTRAGIDNLAHIGGLVAGVLAGLVIEGFGRREMRRVTSAGGMTLLAAAAAMLVWVGTAALGS